MPALSASAVVLLMFIAINAAVPAVTENLDLLGPLVASTILVFPVLFLVAYLVSVKLLPRGKNIAITAVSFYQVFLRGLPAGSPQAFGSAQGS
jgi:hypothetical protein